MEKKCPYCNKIISGQTDRQIDQLMKMHIMNKHYNKVTLKKENGNTKFNTSKLEREGKVSPQAVIEIYQELEKKIKNSLKEKK